MDPRLPYQAQYEAVDNLVRRVQTGLADREEIASMLMDRGLALICVAEYCVTAATRLQPGKWAGPPGHDGRNAEGESPER